MNIPGLRPTGICPACGRPWDDHSGWEHWPLLVCSAKRRIDATKR